MKVTKAQIIEAIKTEPLRAGSWYTTEGDGTCSACAVGAVLRNACKMYYSDIEDHALGKYKSHSSYPDEMLLNSLFQEGRYMEALSCFFEDACENASDEENCYSDEISKSAMSEIRQRTIEFVEKNFPDEVSI